MIIKSGIHSSLYLLMYMIDRTCSLQQTDDSHDGIQENYNTNFDRVCLFNDGSILRNPLDVGCFKQYLRESVAGCWLFYTCEIL